MSLALMTKAETLDISEIEPIFDGVPEIMDGPKIQRTVIGELEGNKLARIRRISMTILKKEVSHYDYEIDLVTPYDFDRFQFDVTLACSALWVVSMDAAREEVVTAQVKNPGEFAILAQSKLQPLASPEEILALYDKEEKGFPAVTPKISPNIYTAEGMLQLINETKFRGAQANG